MIQFVLLLIQMLLIVGLLVAFAMLVMGSIGYRKKTSGKYLYHITTMENAQKIVQNDLATIYATNRRMSYSNFFRRSTFYFDRIPSLVQLWNNIPGYKKGTDLVAVRIEVEKLPKEIKLKTRYHDKAVFHKGPLENVPAEIVEIPSKRIPFVIEPLAVILGSFAITTILLILSVVPYLIPNFLG